MIEKDHSNLCPVLAQTIFKSCLICLHPALLHAAEILLVFAGVGNGGFSAKCAQLTACHNFLERSLIQTMTLLENPDQLSSEGCGGMMVNVIFKGKASATHFYVCLSLDEGNSRVSGMKENMDQCEREQERRCMAVL